MQLVEELLVGTCAGQRRGRLQHRRRYRLERRKSGL